MNDRIPHLRLEFVARRAAQRLGHPRKLLIAALDDLQLRLALSPFLQPIQCPRRPIQMLRPIPTRHRINPIAHPIHIRQHRLVILPLQRRRVPAVHHAAGKIDHHGPIRIGRLEIFIIRLERLVILTVNVRLIVGRPRQQISITLVQSRIVALLANLIQTLGIRGRDPVIQ